MEIIKVSGKETIEEFHRLPDKICRNDANYTPFLRMMIENMFNPESNARFREGDAQRWIVKKDRECVGRIAAFYDAGYSSGYEQPTGCFGFLRVLMTKMLQIYCLTQQKSGFRKTGWKQWTDR